MQQAYADDANDVDDAEIMYMMHGWCTWWR